MTGINLYKAKFKNELDKLCKHSPNLVQEKNIEKFMSNLKRLSLSCRTKECQKRALNLYNTLLYEEGEI